MSSTTYYMTLLVIVLGVSISAGAPALMYSHNRKKKSWKGRLTGSISRIELDQMYEDAHLFSNGVIGSMLKVSYFRLCEKLSSRDMRVMNYIDNTFQLSIAGMRDEVYKCDKYEQFRKDAIRLCEQALYLKDAIKEELNS